MRLALSAVLATALTVLTVTTGCTSDSGSKAKNRDRNQTQPETPPPAISMSASPTISPSILSAGDTVTIAVYTDTDPGVSLVGVNLVDTINGAFLVASGPIDPNNPDPYRHLVTTDFRTWTGTFAVSTLAASDTYHVEVGLMDEETEGVTIYYLDTSQSATFYEQVSAVGDSDAVFGLTSLAIATTHVTARPGTAEYYFFARGDIDPNIKIYSDTYLEITPATAPALNVPYARNDDERMNITNWSTDSRLRVALDSSASYYVRVGAYNGATQPYFVSVQTTATPAPPSLGIASCPDSYESDNSAASAKAMTVGAGWEARSFCPAGDIDWLIFTAP